MCQKFNCTYGQLQAEDYEVLQIFRAFMAGEEDARKLED